MDSRIHVPTGTQFGPNASGSFATGVIRFICICFSGLRRWLQVLTYVFTLFTIIVRFLSATDWVKTLQRPCGSRTEIGQSTCNLHDLRTDIARCPCDVFAEFVWSWYTDFAIVVYSFIKRENY